MFYINELKIKLIYILLTYTLLLIIIYINKQNLFVLTSYSAINYYKFISFFYTHPIELFKIYINLIIFYTTIFFIPIFPLNILDYLTAGLTLNKRKKIKIILYKIIYLFFLYNFIIIFYLLPLFWFYFEDINNILLNSNFIIIFLELKLDEYFNFIFNYVFFFNFFFLIFFICFFLIYLKLKEKTLKYKNYYYYMILIIGISFFSFDLINILIICFLISFIEAFFYHLIFLQKVTFYNVTKNYF